MREVRTHSAAPVTDGDRGVACAGNE